MMGTPVEEVAVASIEPMQKQVAIKKMNPVTEPIHTARTIALGASFLAFLISSVMCAGAS